MKHSPRFVSLVEGARRGILEVGIDEVRRRLDSSPGSFDLVDVREESEWAAGRLPHAVHLGRGILERDVETRIPDLDREIVLYCGGGYRSALAAESLQRMGYRNVRSMAGGFRAWTDASYPVD